jgi:predicted RNase H-like HicB family nuclease
MKAYAFNSVIYKEGRHYVAQCLDVDVSSFGSSEAEALSNLREALELYFEDEPIAKVHKISSPKIIPLQLEHA